MPARRASGATWYGRGIALGRPASSHAVTHSRISFRCDVSTGVGTEFSPVFSSFSYFTSYTSSVSAKYAARFTTFQSSGRLAT